MTEPARRSLLDVLHDQMKAIDRIVYVHRLIYCGEFDFDMNDVQAQFTSSVREVNDHYHDEKLTGFLLLYQRFYVHMIEGSEESLAKHLNSLMKDAIAWGRSKLLVAYHHINQRFFDEWFYETAIPPTSLDKKEPSMDIEENFDCVMQVIKKIYFLCKSLYRPKKPEESTESLPNSESTQSSSVLIYDRKVIISTATDNLPSVTLLEFILASPFVENLDNYAKKFGIPFEIEQLQRPIWPLAPDYVPFNVFNVDEDPVQDLPHTSDIPRIKSSKKISVITSQTMMTPVPSVPEP